MLESVWKGKKGNWIAVRCVVGAIVCRQLTSENPYVTSALFLLRSLCYLSLYGFWALSIQRRVLHKTLRYCLMTTAFLIVFWMSVRTCKYMIPDTMQTALRLGWYLYYIPMILIPTVSVFLALHIRKPEDYRIPGKLWMAMAGIAVFLILAVLTNDLHQQVFRFPEGLEMGNKKYRYGPLYVLLVIWDGGCALTTLVSILQQSRTERSRRYAWMPFGVLGLIFLYTAVSFFQFPLWKLLCGDITSAYCLLYVILLESCILSGMIPVNTGYEEMFQVCTATAQITDLEYEIRYRSGKGLEKQESPISKEMMKQTEQGPVILQEGIRLSGAPVRGGHVLWQEDISELLKNLKELEDAAEELKDANLLEEENMKASRRLERLKVKNQLYDLVRTQTQRQIQILSGLVSRYCEESSPGEQRRILGKMVVVGAYLKRRSNLIFLTCQNSRISIRELVLCIEESMRSLTLYGVDCACRDRADGTISGTAAMEVYDFFERVVETALETLEALQAGIEPVEGGMVLRLCIECGTELSGLLSGREEDGNHPVSGGKKVEIVKDFDGSWIISFWTGEEVDEHEHL